MFGERTVFQKAESLIHFSALTFHFICQNCTRHACDPCNTSYNKEGNNLDFPSQADAQAKRATDSEYELARVREQLADAAAAAALAGKGLEEEKRSGTERLEKERKELADVRAELLAEHERKSGEMIASLHAVEEAFEQEKGAHEAEKQKLQDEIADLR